MESQGSPARPERSPLLYIPPPLHFLGCFLAGAQLEWLIAPSALPPPLTTAAWVVGVALVSVAGLLVLTAPGLLLFHRTTLIPHATSRALVTTGPYRLTRNPMYLSLVCAYVGVALLMNVLWALLLLPFPLWVIQTRVIPVEEAALTEAFGDEYRAYQRRVRRWI